jgi:putative Mg2+ transporter-C (MgtC) family protein
MMHQLATLGFAAIGGTVIGLERELANKAAGLRTHMLVSVGAALFLLCITEVTPQVVQGVATGVGFIGGGAILKGSERVDGITTATTIWIAAAVGSCIASGQIVVGLAGAVLTLVTLVVLRRAEAWIHDTAHPV